MSTTLTIGFGAWLLEKIKDKGFDALYSKLTDSNKIDDAFNIAVTNTSNKLSLRHPDVLGGRIDYFFRTESIFKELVKLLFINSTVNIDVISSHFDTHTLPPNFILDFISELRSELLKDIELSKLIYNKELYILIYGISKDIETIALNSNLTVAEITDIKNILEERIGKKFIYNEFINLYANNAINNLSQINFIGLGVGVDISKKINRKKLDDIFIKPSFKISENKLYKDRELIENLDIEEEFTIEYNQLFSFGDRIVVLGNPGSGKSVLIKSIICNLLSKKNAFDENVNNYLPFRIELRKYLAYKKQNRGNIVKYLNSLLEEEYGINNITEILLETILNSKPNIFFFDGLDEIFKVSDKIEIKNDIEIFHNTFPNSKSITTSRIIGYDKARLNEENFGEVHISNFTDSQIEEYVNKWYEKEEDSIERRVLEVNGFLSKKHEIDYELVSNPLLLSLIVIIYRNTLAIPESKLEIYQSCTKTLVEKWDASKTDLEINLDISIYKKRENILADLAYWQYQQLSGDQIEITFEKALNILCLSLERLKICDDFDSYSMAESFMEYAQKRSIYFDNNFTHKTFLEYYAAYWIYSNIEKKNKTEERNLLISRFVENPFWHIVLELLLNMIDKNQADTEIMDDLINYQIFNDNKSLPFILSTINSYKNVGRDCINGVIDYTLNLLIDKYEQSLFSLDSINSKVFETSKTIFNSDDEIKKIILKKLISKEQELKNKKIVYALYFEINLIDSAYSDDNYTFDLSDEKEFNYYLNNDKFFIISSCYNIRAMENTANYMQVCIDFIKKFGKEDFCEPIPLYYEHSSYLPMIAFYFRTQIYEENIIDFTKNINILLSNGIEVNHIINYLIERKHFLLSHIEIKLIDLIDNEEDNRVNLIIAILLFASSVIIKNKVKDEIRNRKNTDFFIKISELPREERIFELCKHYNFTRS